MKQESIEEEAKNCLKENRLPIKGDFAEGYIVGAIFGSEWQQERSYSEEDMISFAEFVATYLDKNRNVNGEMLHAKSKYDGAERTIDLLKQYKK
jgi:hypothetical protein